MNEAQVKQIRNIQAEIDAERAEMDGGKKDPHPTDYDIKIIPNPHSPIAQQN